MIRTGYEQQVRDIGATGPQVHGAVRDPILPTTTMVTPPPTSQPIAPQPIAPQPATPPAPYPVAPASAPSTTVSLTPGHVRVIAWAMMGVLAMLILTRRARR